MSAEIEYITIQVPIESYDHFIRAMITVRISFRMKGEDANDIIDTDIDVVSLIEQGIKLELIGEAVSYGLDGKVNGKSIIIKSHK